MLAVLDALTDRQCTARWTGRPFSLELEPPPPPPAAVVLARRSGPRAAGPEPVAHREPRRALYAAPLPAPVALRRKRQRGNGQRRKPKAALDGVELEWDRQWAALQMSLRGGPSGVPNVAPRPQSVTVLPHAAHHGLDRSSTPDWGPAVDLESSSQALGGGFDENNSVSSWGALY